MPIKEYETLLSKTKEDNFKKELEEIKQDGERKRKTSLAKKAETEKQRAIEEEKKAIEEKRHVKESLAGKLIDKTIGKLNDSCNYPGVYLIVNNKTLDFYIGESQNLAFRRLTHLGDLVDPKKDHSSTLMQKHFDEFGANCFDFYVIERVNDDTVDGKARKSIETFYIKEHKPSYNSGSSFNW